MHQAQHGMAASLASKVRNLGHEAVVPSEQEPPESSQVIAQVELVALERAVLAAKDETDRVSALASYAITALVCDAFWQKGMDGNPVVNRIFGDIQTAAQVGRKIFAACRWITDLDAALRTQIGDVMADYWKKLTLAVLQPDGQQRTEVSPVAASLLPLRQGLQS